MADTLSFDDLIPKDERSDGLTFDDLIPEDQRPKTGLVDRAIDLYRQPVEEKETAPGRIEPGPVGSDPMGDSAGQAIMRDAPMPEPKAPRVRDSSVVADQPYNDGKGNEGDPLRDLGLGAANAAGGNVFGDFYDPTGSNVVAGQVASKALTPFTMAAAKGLAGATGDAATGLSILADQATNGAVKLDWAMDMGKWASGQAKLVRGEVNSVSEIEGVGDFGTYLVERFGEAFGSFAPFMFGGPATAVGIGAVQGVGSTYHSLMEDKGIQEKLKSGELNENNVRRIAMVGGVVNGLVMGGVVKVVGSQGKFTKDFEKDLIRLAMVDPAVFAGSATLTSATNELLAGYFGGNSEIGERVARVADATVNGFFGGVPFGGAKVTPRIERRVQAMERLENRPKSEAIQAIPENGVAQETAAALSKDAGTAAASSDVDPTIQAATQADAAAKVKAAVAKVREMKAADEAAEKEAAKASDAEKIKAGIEATKDPVQALPDIVFNGDLRHGIERVMMVEDGPGEVRLQNVGFRPEEVAALEQAGLATDGVMSRNQFNKYDAEVSRRKKPVEFDPKKSDFGEIAIERLTKKGIELSEEQKEQIRNTVRAARKEKKNFGEILDGLYQDYGAAPKDTGITVPEAPQTLDVQFKDLVDKNRNIMLFPSKDGKPADTSVAGERPKGVFEVVKPEGTYWYRTGRGGTSKEKLNAARKDPDALAELLGYGPSKEKVAETSKPGDPDLTVVERTTDGTEVKASATNPELLKETVDAVEANKGAPERTVTVEKTEDVLKGREEGTGKAPEAEAAAPAPAGAGPKAAPVVVRLKSRARKDKAPEAPKPETAVTPEVTPEPQKPQGRVLRSAEQEAEIARENANLERGMRLTTEGDNRDFGVAPDTSNPKARDRFTRRAAASVKVQGDAAPQYYKDAVEAKAAQTKGRTAANMERTKKIDAAWQQEHEENLRVIERRKAEAEEAAKAADAPEPETDARYEPKRDYTDEQIKRVIDEIAAQIPREKDRAAFLATEPEKLRLLAALELDRRKSDRSGGQSDVNEAKNTLLLDENRTATRSDDVVDSYAKLKGEPISLFDRLMARLEASEGERGKLAERLNAMTDEQFKNWIVRADKGEFLKAVRSADEFGITRLKADEFRRLLNEIADAPIIASREATVREMFDENKLAPREPNEKLSVRDQMSAFIERRVMSLIGDMKVMVVDNDTIRRANIRSGRSDKIGGSYDPIKNHILLNEDFYVPGTAEGRALLIHEALHGVLANTLRRSKALAAQIEKLRDFVETELQNNPELRAKFEALDIKYGLKNIDEFISEAWSNRDFQDLLSEINISEKQLRDMGINPAQGWVRNGFRAIVEALRQAIGTTPNTRTALEEAIRYTDAAFEARELLGKGAAKSALMPSEMARAMAAKETRPIKFDDYAAKRGPEQVVRRELESAGFSRGEAEEFVKALRDEMGAEFTFKNAKPIIDELVRDYKSNQEAPPPKSDAEVQADIRKIAEEATGGAEDFVPSKTHKRPWAITVRFSKNDQLAQMGDRWFGPNNPLRKIANAIERQAFRKREYLKEFEGSLVDLLKASKEFAGEKGFDDLIALAQDATMAQVHPDVPLTDAKNKHLGQDALKGMWGKARHAELSERWNKLATEHPELAKVYTETRDLLTRIADKVLERAVAATLRVVDIDDVQMARRFTEGNETPQDKTKVGKSVFETIETLRDQARLKGPYFNLSRRGDFVVNAYYKIETPNPTLARKVNENTFDFKNRDEAIKWAQSQKLNTSLETVHVDPKTGETFFTDANGERVDVTAKDIDGEPRYRAHVQNQHTEFFNSERMAKKKANELREMGLKVWDVEPRKKTTDMGNSKLMHDQMRMVMETLDKRLAASKLDQKQKNEVIGAFNEMSIMLLGSNRIQSNLLPRRYVQGASLDLVRNTFEYADRAAGYMARADFSDAIRAGVKEADERTTRLSEKGTGNGAGARMLTEEMTKRAVEAGTFEDPTGFSRFIDRINTLSFNDKLASPGYSIRNATQGMLTHAELSGDHGVMPATAALLRAYNDIGAFSVLGRGVADTGRAFAAKEAKTSLVEDVISRAAKTDGERDMFRKLIEVNAINPDAGFEIQRYTRSREGAGGAIDTGLGYMTDITSAMPRAVEVINRVPAALAAYRLELSRANSSHEKAVQYAQDVVNNTQFNNSTTNVPRDFRRSALRPSLQFKLYLQGAIHAIARQVGRAYRNENPGDRLKAARALAVYTAGYASLAGVLGIPGMELAKIGLLVANALGFSDFKPSDFEQMVREYMAKKLGKTGGELASRGLTRAIGIDTSNSLGFPTLFFGEPRGDKESDTKAWLLDFVIGAPGSLGFDMAKGVRAFVDGDPAKGFELMIPNKFIADSIRAGRQYAEGKKDQGGRETLSPYTKSEAFTRAMGFTPAREAERSEERAAIGGALNDYNKQRQKLIQDWTANPDNRAKAMIAIEKFNRDKPKDAQIDMKDLRTAEKRRKTDIESRAETKGLRTTKRNDYLIERRDIYNTGN